MTLLPTLPVVKISAPIKTFRFVRKGMLGFLPLGSTRIVYNTLNFSKSKRGGRFNGSARGTWYCAFEKDTAIEEAVYHQTRRMDKSGDIDGDEDEVIFQEFFA